MRITPRTRAWRFSTATPGQRQVGQEGVHHRLDRLDAVVQPGALGQLGGVVAGVRRGVRAGHGDADHAAPAPSASTAIAATTRRVDAAGEARAPPTGSRSCGRSRAAPAPAPATPRPRRSAGRRSRRRRGGLRRRRSVAGHRRRAGHPHLAAASPRRRGAAGSAGGRVRSCTSRCSVNCGARASSSPVRRDDHRVAVEDQLVLATDHVDVGDRGAGLAPPGGATSGSRTSSLLHLVRRAVDVDHQPDSGPAAPPRTALRPATGPRRW